MLRYMCAVSLSLLPSIVFAQEPIQRACPTGVLGMHVRFVGQRGDLIEIHDQVSKKHYRAYDESREDMDGARDVLKCGGVFSGGGVIVIRTGRKSDYVQIYGVARSESNVELYQYRWNPLDDTIDVTLAPRGEVKLRNGRKRDRFYTVCWNSQSRTLSHSVAANQFTGGHLACNQNIPADRVRRLQLTYISQDLPEPPPPVPTGPAPQIAGYRLFCMSGTGTGNIEYWGRGTNCASALSDAQSEIRRLGGCSRMGSNYTEIRRESLKTSACP